jgi:exodeoxyribonuclease V beta subunit
MSLVLDLPLRGSQLIEASAGTGKTFTIALLYVRLVLGHGAPDDQSNGRDNGFTRTLTPPEILVVTFTEAATQELKGRIRERLVDAAKAFREAPAEADLESKDPLLALRNEYPTENWSSCARRLQLAAEWMDDAAVSTIHSWCYRMLSEHAFDSGSLFSQTLVTNQSELVTTAVQDYWRSRFYPMAPVMAVLVYETFEAPAALEKALRPLIKREECRLEFQQTPIDMTPLPEKLSAAGSMINECRQAEELARKAWQAGADELRSLLQGLRKGMNGNSFRGKDDDDTFTGWLEGIQAWADGGEPNSFVKKLGRDTLKLKKGHEVPAHPFFDLIETWQCATQGVPDLKPQILADARDWVLERMQRQLHDRAEMGFDDLLKRLDKALAGENGPQLAQRIREQFPMAMIDEFQDTDPLQYRIFEQIYRVSQNDDQTGIILIGDPKQAIYSFRGADIRTYLQAKAETSGRHHTLGKNFRSSCEMVNAVNSLFLHGDMHARGAFRHQLNEDNPLPFQEVVAKGRKETLEINGTAAPALTAWWHAVDDWLRPDDYLTVMAEHAAESLSQWLAQAKTGQTGFRDGGTLTPLRASDVAILVRDRNEAAVMREALSRRQLPSVYLSDRDSVFASDEARDLLYWLQACAEPDNDSLVRTALASPTMRLSLSWLDKLHQDELAWEEYQDRFHRYRHRWQKVGVLPMIRLLMQEFDLASRLLEDAGGERRLTNLLHLAEWAQQASELLDGEQALIRELAEHYGNPGGEEQILRLESDADLVKVVTFHKSKGLEYPIVLLPFIAGWSEVDGRRGRPIYENDGVVVELGKKAEAAEAYAKADDERLSEDMRLLYVALTRARHATCLGVAPLAQGNAKKPQVHKGSLGYLLTGGTAVKTADELKEALEAALNGCAHSGFEVVTATSPVTLAPQDSGTGAYVPARRPTHAAFQPWWVASYTAIVERHSGSIHAPDTPAESTQAEESLQIGRYMPAGVPEQGTIHAFPRGPEAGTLLHGLLEWAGTEGFDEALANIEERKRMVERRCRVRGWGEFADALDTWLSAQLAMPLLASEPTMTPANLKTYLVEQDFWFEASNVATPELDRLITRHTLEGVQRPALGLNRLNGMLKGFIDLIAEHNQQYFVLDWKSNWLGANSEAYQLEPMRQAMRDKRHDVQMCLYVLALHRHLRQRLPDYDYDRDVGGALYVFVRAAGGEPGLGVYHEKPPLALIEALDALFAGKRIATASQQEAV